MAYFEPEVDLKSLDDFWGKYLEVNGPGGLRFSVDYDDVNHFDVAVLLQQALAILNTYWVPVEARVCSNPWNGDDEDWSEERDFCGLRLYPLDGPNNCPVCDAPLEAKTVG